MTCTSCDYFWRWDRSTSRLSVTHLHKVENLLSDNGQRLISLWQIVDCWFQGHRPSWAEVCLSLSPLCPECPKCTLTLVPTMHTHSLLLSLSLSLSYTPNLYVPSVPSVPYSHTHTHTHAHTYTHTHTRTRTHAHTHAVVDTCFVMDASALASLRH